ncbi:MAG: hypothetical protein KC587_04330 [Nitrospira sp.]|nr:hypothetical protein [Nitrospira sp.]
MSSLRTVESRLKRFDKALSLRDPGGDCPFVYVERKAREGRKQVIGKAMKDLLGDGTSLLGVLKRNDTWAAGGGKKFMDEFDEHERITERSRKRKRKEEFIDQAREERDIAHRLKGKRVNNAGVPT